MNQNIVFKLLSLRYSGDSIGEDIKLEIKIGDNQYTWEQRIKHGSTVEINQEVARIPQDELSQNSNIHIKIIEKDIIFSDKGESQQPLTINEESLPFKFSAEVKVRERRITLRKSTAIFTLNFIVEKTEKTPAIRQYNKGPRGEDYNVYDSKIAKYTNEWNEEFSKQQDPPQEPLDPNLVKAMMYVESKIGNYLPEKGYSGHPDVMQVADPRNDAIYALKNIYNPNPGRKKKATEYEVINGKLQKFYYPQANGETVEDSIKWGVRWLYHVAQDNIKVEGGWKRGWKDWKEAVYWYNGGGDSEYQNKVYSAYQQGSGERNYKLWSIVLLLLAGAGTIYFALYSSLTVYDKWTAEKSIIQPMIAGVSTEYQPAPKYASVKKILSNSEPRDTSLKRQILNSYSPEELEQIETIITERFESTIFLTVVEFQKDWWEEIKVGKIQDNTISWFNIGVPPTEQSILSARFVTLKGVPSPVVEIFGKTHMGNGHIYLYSINNQKLNLMLDTVGVDFHNESVWKPEGYPKYGYMSCGEVYKDGKLDSSYQDLNKDGIDDIILSGTTEVICEKIEDLKPYAKFKEVKVDEIPVRLSYILKTPN